MPELDFEDHSEEVQQILGQIPKWIIRWGITVLFLIIAMIFIGSNFIPYPVKITLPIKITTQNAPAPLVSQGTSTRISKWLVQDGQLVKKGDVLAFWESEDKYGHVLKLQELLKRANLEPLSDTLTLPSFLSAIRNLNRSITGLTSVRNSKKHLQDIRILEVSINQEIGYLELLKKQELVREREFELLEKKFKQDSTFFYAGDYGILQQDFNRELLQFLQKKSSFIQYKASLQLLDRSLITMKNNILEVRQQRKSDLELAKEKLEESLFSLNKMIREWKLKNLLIAPIEGEIDRASFWSKNQLVQKGQAVATILPRNPKSIICRAFASVENVGLINKGQKALIELDGFNQQQFGIIEGHVIDISTIPFNNEYIVSIGLPNQMITMDNKQIPMIHELTGKAEVIISESTLFEKLIGFNKSIR